MRVTAYQCDECRAVSKYEETFPVRVRYLDLHFCSPSHRDRYTSAASRGERAAIHEQYALDLVDFARMRILVEVLR